MMDATFFINRNNNICFGLIAMDIFGCGQNVQSAFMKHSKSSRLLKVVEIFKINISSWSQIEVLVVDKDLHEIHIVCQ